MKVKLIRKASVETYIAQNARSKSSMNTFLEVLKVSDWSSPNDIKTLSEIELILCAMETE